ncbi:MAG: ROK family protein [Pirellulales bacterium]|nr:ROK family protein [Pirellulales bacterium]
MFLGIEIGGTKLQLGIGSGRSAELLALERRDVSPAAGATGILREIAAAAEPLLARYPVRGIGIGFGGPVDARSGRVITSHHIEGWDEFPLVEWCGKTFGLPAWIGNDADLAGLAEASLGAGQGANPVFYVTIGTGIGGGLIVDRRVFQGHGRAAAEIGHLRPGLLADRPEETVESMASGLGIAAAARERMVPEATRLLSPHLGGGRLGPEHMRQRLIETEAAAEEHAADLWERCDGRLEQLTARHVVAAAAEGNELALEVLQRAWQALGWAIAQVITLVSPEKIVIGGGVSLAGETLLFEPLRAQVARYVFPPLADSYEICPAALGEEMVVFGALALAAHSAVEPDSTG